MRRAVLPARLGGRLGRDRVEQAPRQPQHRQAQDRDADRLVRGQDADLATGDKPSARLASTNCVIISATMVQWNSCATAPYRVRVFFRCMGMSTGETVASLSD